MRFLAAILLTAALTVAAHAQGQRAGGPPPDAAPVKGATTGFMHAIHATNNVETTLAFYTEVFGLGGKVAPFANPGRADADELARRQPARGDAADSRALDSISS